MFEIIIMLMVMGWFSKQANTFGKSGILWALIAAISFYVPVLIFGRMIFPALIEGKVTYSNQTSYVIIGTLSNIAIGALFLLLARAILLKSVKKWEGEEDKKIGLEKLKRTPFIDLEDPNISVGSKAYDKNKENYLGKITKLNISDESCVIMSDFGAEIVKSFNEILVKIED